MQKNSFMILALAKLYEVAVVILGIFSPCKYNKTKLIDGGIRDNTPWKKLKEIGANTTLSVCFETTNICENKNKNFIETITKSFDILMHELSNCELNGADYILRIKTNKISLLDTSKIDYLYNLGYSIAKNKINEIKKEINK